METEGGVWRTDMIVALFETLVVVGVAGVIVYAMYGFLSGIGHGTETSASVAGRWETAHYGVNGVTRVVVRKTAPRTGKPLDEHVVAVIPDDDPDYDEKFLHAMAQARSRAALFASED
jgi:hypothetical protein